MTRAGARGDTAAQMDAVMHFTLKDEKLHAAFAALLKETNGDPADKKRDCQLSTANALWGQINYDFRPDFLQLVKEEYGGGFDVVDYINAREQARKAINAWAAKRTQDKVQDLLQADDLNDLTRLVLTNAIYFKGNWASQFKKDLTKAAPFHLGADKHVDAPMMRQNGRFGYFDGGVGQALELPYVGQDLSMVVLLPKERDGLAGLEKDLSAYKLAGWLDGLQEQEVAVALPKFKATFTARLETALKEMGMPKPFDSLQADFSGMDGRKGLFIQHVVHKAVVEVDEEGTEAAASTAVIMGLGGPPPRTPEFRADHPFLFLIRDRRSGSILFLGRVTDPTK